MTRQRRGFPRARRLRELRFRRAAAQMPSRSRMQRASVKFRPTAISVFVAKFSAMLTGAGITTTIATAKALGVWLRRMSGHAEDVLTAANRFPGRLLRQTI